MINFFEIVNIKIYLCFIIYILFSGFCILGGFDIGSCILLPFITKKDIDRRIIINSISENWDGNQVWFVTLVGLIFSIWPVVYSIILSSLYNVIFFMIFFLIIRPVSLDFRSKIDNKIWKNIFDFFIFFSNFFIIFMFGFIVGIVLQGIPFEIDKNNINYLKHSIQINYFDLLLGILFVVNSIIQGSIYLQIKTENNIKNTSNEISNFFIIIQMLLIPLFLYSFLFKIDGYLNIKNILNFKNIYLISNNNDFIIKFIGAWKFKYAKNSSLYIIPFIYFISSFITFIFNIYYKNYLSLLFSSINIIMLKLFIFVSVFPFIIPCSCNPNSSITIWNCTSSYNTLKIISLFITLFFPIVIFYTIYVYKKTLNKINKKFINNNKDILY